jgi:FkbM family methyltransferase
LRFFFAGIRDLVRINQITAHVRNLLPNLLVEKNDELGVIVDLGANRGDFTRWIRRRKEGLILAFEPHPVAFDYLSAKTRRSKDIIRLQMAVSNQNQLRDFYVPERSRLDPLGYATSASLIDNKQSVQFSRVLSLDLSIFFQFLPQVFVLKVDIEGSEAEIWNLIRESSEKIKYLLMEIHDNINPILRSEINSFISENNLSHRWTANWI